MEDNEFDEVTIISHTDHGTSVLPQSTAERLMKEIKLEVTQKISQNENVKLGSLEGSTTPTLLDAIHQYVESHDQLDQECYYIAANPFTKNTENHSFIVAHETLHMEVSFTPDKGYVVRELVESNMIVYNILLWGEYIICFWPGVKLGVYTPKDQQGLFRVPDSQFNGGRSQHVKCNSKYFFFKSRDGISRCDTKMNCT